MQAMGLKDVQLALERLELEIEIMAYDSSTATSQQAADSARCNWGRSSKASVS